MEGGLTLVILKSPNVCKKLRIVSQKASTMAVKEINQEIDGVIDCCNLDMAVKIVGYVV
ncbi:5565_t:CDS:2 [Entrophospora sp. SA101]|nr:5565_t:CDS:2 [Entrophospora sp. SA101]